MASPYITLLAPDHLCRTDGWRGTTNVAHVIVHSPDLSTNDISAMFPHVSTNWGLSIQSPFAPVGRTTQRSLSASVRAEGAAVSYYSEPPLNPETNALPLTHIGPGASAATFYLRPNEDQLAPVQITVEIMVEGLIVGTVSSSIETAPLGGSASMLQSSRGFKQIFISYARPDMRILQGFESMVSSTGFVELWWDLKCLRAGETWSDRIFDAILASDSFQLLWSKSASRSRNVRKEWMFALNRKQSGFIKPVYWDEPMVRPPKELREIHFARIQIPALESPHAD